MIAFRSVFENHIIISDFLNFWLIKLFLIHLLPLLDIPDNNFLNFLDNQNALARRNKEIRYTFLLSSIESLLFSKSIHAVQLKCLNLTHDEFKLVLDQDHIKARANILIF